MSAAITRRAFIGTSGVAAGGVALGALGCVGSSPELGLEASETAIRRFRSQLTGRLILPQDDEYEAARRIWNGLIDRRPAAIANCADRTDVRRCIAFARERDLSVAVRGGGHHAAGFAMVADGLVIDLSGLTDVDVDLETRIAKAGPGVLAGSMHRATQKTGLVLPTGTVPSVGLAGLTLGGGEGWLTPKYGLTCDNLLSAEVVTAEGDFVRASENENPDLLWGLRGGGGNFGVVTSFEYGLHPLSQVVHGMVVYPAEKGRDVLRYWRDRMAVAPDDLGSMIVYVQAPDPMLMLGVCYAGPDTTADRTIDPLRGHGAPAEDTVRRISVLDLFGQSDAGSQRGAANYWRTHYLQDLSDDAIDTLLEYCRRATSTRTAVWMWHYHGAFRRVPTAATASPHREAAYEIGIAARWSVSEKAERHILWAREFWKALVAFATGGIYSNYSSDMEHDTSAAAYGVNLPRLAQLKRQYDPSNLFRANVNVQAQGDPS
jgi:FAD/FMN-containing dehydrogenase